MSDYLNITPKKYKKLRIDDFLAGVNRGLDSGVLEPATAAEIYNFDFAGGALKDGLGLSDCGVETSLCKYIWRFDTGNYASDVENVHAGALLMLSRSSGDVFYLDNGLKQLYGVSVSGRVYTANYNLYGKNVIIICSENGDLYVWDGENAAYKAEGAPKIKSLAAFEGLCFLVNEDGRTVKYTDDPDPTGWSESLAGCGSMLFADAGGRANCLMPLSSGLYVFREFGIARISIVSDTPKAAGLFVSSGRIYPRTVVQCGSSAVFLSADGLYRFDGLSAKSVLPALDGYIMPNENAVACWSGGRYYLACRVRRGVDCECGGDCNCTVGSGCGCGATLIGCERGEYNNNALICFNPESGEYSISRGIDITCLAQASDSYADFVAGSSSDAGNMGVGKVGFYAVSGGRICKSVDSAEYLEESLEKCWRSGLSDLKSEKVKVVKEVFLETKGDIVLSVSTENGTRSKAVSADSAPQRIRFNVRGRKIGFSIKSSVPNAHISRVVIVYYEV